MQDELVVDEIKRVGSSFEWMRDHLIDELCWQRREFINVLARVPRVGNAIAKVEIERLQQLFLVIMPLNHSEIFHIFIADLKLDAVIIK